MADPSSAVATPCGGKASRKTRPSSSASGSSEGRPYPAWKPLGEAMVGGASKPVSETGKGGIEGTPRPPAAPRRAPHHRQNRVVWGSTAPQVPHHHTGWS